MCQSEVRNGLGQHGDLMRSEFQVAGSIFLSGCYVGKTFWRRQRRFRFTCEWNTGVFKVKFSLLTYAGGFRTRSYRYRANKHHHFLTIGFTGSRQLTDLTPHSMSPKDVSLSFNAYLRCRTCLSSMTIESVFLLLRHTKVKLLQVLY